MEEFVTNDPKWGGFTVEVVVHLNTEVRGGLNSGATSQIQTISWQHLFPLGGLDTQYFHHFKNVPTITDILETWVTL